MNTLSVLVCTLGVKTEPLISKIKVLEEFCRVTQVSAEVIISCNFPNKQAQDNFYSEPFFKKFRIISHSTYFESAEKHLLEVLKMYSDITTDSFLWPISDEDPFNPKELENFLRFLRITPKKAVLMNWQYQDRYGKLAPNPTIIYNSVNPSVKELILECGVLHAPSKIGSWAIHTRALTHARLRVWENWFDFTELWTHSLFVFFLATDLQDAFVYYDGVVFYSVPNPTDEDLVPQWKQYFKQTRKIFQFDYTFGLVKVLADLESRRALTQEEISFMTISDEQRGTMPMINDIEWRIYNQCRRALYLPEERMEPKLIGVFADELRKWSSKNEVFINNMEVAIATTRIPAKERFKTVARLSKSVNWNNDWRRFQVYSNGSHAIYRLATHYLTVPNYLNVENCVRLSHVGHRSELIFENSDLLAAITQVKSLEVTEDSVKTRSQFLNPKDVYLPRFFYLYFFLMKIVHQQGIELSKFPRLRRVLIKMLGLHRNE
jgi:hypothetical protein